MLYQKISLWWRFFFGVKCRRYWPKISVYSFIFFSLSSWVEFALFSFHFSILCMHIYIYIYIYLVHYNFDLLYMRTIEVLYLLHHSLKINYDYHSYFYRLNFVLRIIFSCFGSFLRSITLWFLILLQFEVWHFWKFFVA